MRCLTPITIVCKEPWQFRIAARQHRQRTYDVPCGKCLACLQSRRQDWVFRLKQELRVSSSCYFVTLTYDDSHLPRDDTGKPVLNKRDCQLFLHRLRHSKQVKENTCNIRYYLCGEYGSQTQRPHYHAIMYNLPVYNDLNNIKLRLLIQDTWKLGGVYVVPVTGARISYVTKYLLTYDEDKNSELPVMSPLMSRKPGIGSNFVVRYKDYIREHQQLYVVSDGIKKRMPRYYRDKFFTVDELRSISLEQQRYIEDNIQELSPLEEIAIICQRSSKLHSLSKKSQI